MELGCRSGVRTRAGTGCYPCPIPLLLLLLLLLPAKPRGAAVQPVKTNNSEKPAAVYSFIMVLYACYKGRRVSPNSHCHNHKFNKPSPSRSLPLPSSLSSSLPPPSLSLSPSLSGGAPRRQTASSSLCGFSPDRRDPPHHAGVKQLDIRNSIPLPSHMLQGSERLCSGC